VCPRGALTPLRWLLRARCQRPPSRRAPSAASNSRRPMVTVIRSSRARCVKGRIPRDKRAVPNSAAPGAGGAHAGGCNAERRLRFQEIYLRPRRFTSSRTCGTILARGLRATRPAQQRQANLPERACKT